MYDIKKDILRFTYDVCRVLENIDTSPNHILVRVNTPEIIRHYTGAEDEMILISKRHIKSAVGMLKSSRAHNHSISEDVLHKLPILLDNPRLIARSISADATVDDYIIMIKEVDKNGFPILVSIFVNGKGIYNNKYVKTNMIKSIYGRNEYAEFYKRMSEKQVILYEENM